ncbi:multidrug effflux MFS transporter [Cellulomonas citrea]|uniref:multidrug effflux MFS transporter n=1 Tax=Cellulomonas citrea TaxID=1909423 RepID=UPI00135C6881|nr:multidrug effflux MFS transporter [Cellulomonas citrea]
MPPLSPVARVPRARHVLLLGLMVAVQAFSTDVYLPSLPDVARDLHASVASVQLTMTVMLLGGAVGQLVVGPVSDRFGRRAPALVGLGLHVLTSVACAFAPTVGVLIGLRAAQGFFNAASVVVAMAVVRDLFVGGHAARLLSRLMLVIGLAPLLAPSVGGFVAAHAGWRAVFGVLALYGVLVWVAVLVRLPETLPPAARRPGGIRAGLTGYAALVRDRHFVALAVLPGLSTAVLMSYVVSSPFVLRTGYGLSEQQFALVFAVNGIGLVGGAQLNAALVHKVAPLRVLRVAQLLIAVLGLVLVALAATGAGGLPALLVVLWLLMATLNLASPNANALAMSRHGQVAGSAAAVIGAAQAGVSGVVSPLSGLLGGGAVAMAAVMAGAALVGVAVLALATPAYRRGGGWGG